jgi:hypothetical protein
LFCRGGPGNPQSGISIDRDSAGRLGKVACDIWFESVTNERGLDQSFPFNDPVSGGQGLKLFTDRVGEFLEMGAWSRG